MLFGNDNRVDEYGGRHIKKRPVSISNGLPVTQAQQFDFRFAEQINLTTQEEEEIRQNLLQGKTRIVGSFHGFPVMVKSTKSDTFGEDTAAGKNEAQTALIVVGIIILVAIVLAIVIGYMATTSIMTGDSLKIEPTDGKYTILVKRVQSLLQSLFSGGGATESQIAFSYALLANLILAILTGTVPLLIIGIILSRLFNYYQNYMKEYAKAVENGILEVYAIPVTDKYYYADADTVCDYLEIGGVAVEVHWTLYNKVAVGQKQKCAFLKYRGKQYFAVII